MGIIKIEGFLCERCNHGWVSRNSQVNSGNLPVVCPKCHSPYWNLKRKAENKSKIKKV